MKFADIEFNFTSHPYPVWRGRLEITSKVGRFGDGSKTYILSAVQSESHYSEGNTFEVAVLQKDCNPNTGRRDFVPIVAGNVQGWQTTTDITNLIIEIETTENWEQKLIDKENQRITEMNLEHHTS